VGFGWQATGLARRQSVTNRNPDMCRLPVFSTAALAIPESGRASIRQAPKQRQALFRGWVPHATPLRVFPERFRDHDGLARVPASRKTRRQPIGKSTLFGYFERPHGRRFCHFRTAL